LPKFATKIGGAVNSPHSVFFFFLVVTPCLYLGNDQLPPHANREMQISGTLADRLVAAMISLSARTVLFCTANQALKPIANNRDHVVFVSVLSRRSTRSGRTRRARIKPLRATVTLIDMQSIASFLRCAMFKSPSQLRSTSVSFRRSPALLLLLLHRYQRSGSILLARTT
jgi:hypothetical protein